jgi:hypothetical protein
VRRSQIQSGLLTHEPDSLDALATLEQAIDLRGQWLG